MEKFLFKVNDEVTRTCLNDSYVDLEEVHGNWESFVDAVHTFFSLQDHV